jgi:hypothetical protein
MPAIERDPFAGPVLQRAAGLLQLLAKGVANEPRQATR